MSELVQPIGFARYGPGPSSASHAHLDSEEGDDGVGKIESAHQHSSSFSRQGSTTAASNTAAGENDVYGEAEAMAADELRPHSHLDAIMKHESSTGGKHLESALVLNGGSVDDSTCDRAERLFYSSKSSRPQNAVVGTGESKTRSLAPAYEYAISTAAASKPRVASFPGTQESGSEKAESGLAERKIDSKRRDQGDMKVIGAEQTHNVEGLEDGKNRHPRAPSRGPARETFLATVGRPEDAYQNLRRDLMMYMKDVRAK